MGVAGQELSRDQHLAWLGEIRGKMRHGSTASRFAAIHEYVDRETSNVVSKKKRKRDGFPDEAVESALIINPSDLEAYVVDRKEFPIVDGVDKAKEIFEKELCEYYQIPGKARFSGPGIGADFFGERVTVQDKDLKQLDLGKVLLNLGLKTKD